MTTTVNRKEVAYRGLQIYSLHHPQPFFDKGEYIHDGFGVSDGGVNPMPGACWFRTEGKAKQGIDALLLAGYIPGLPNTGLNPAQPKDIGKKFWTILRVADSEYIDAAVQLRELVEAVPEVKKFDFKIHLKGQYESYIM